MADEGWENLADWTEGIDQAAVARYDKRSVPPWSGDHYWVVYVATSASAEMIARTRMQLPIMVSGDPVDVSPIVCWYCATVYDHRELPCEDRRVPADG